MLNKALFYNNNILCLYNNMFRYGIFLMTLCLWLCYCTCSTWNIANCLAHMFHAYRISLTWKDPTHLWKGQSQSAAALLKWLALGLVWCLLGTVMLNCRVGAVSWPWDWMIVRAVSSPLTQLHPPQARLLNLFEPRIDLGLKSHHSGDCSRPVCCW